MRVSVVTPVSPRLKSTRHLEQTVQSVLSQEGNFELEYLIRDGGSTNATLDFLRNLDGRCIVVSERDGSPQRAINNGMAAATGDVGCWLSADDVLEPGALAAVAAAFEKRPDLGWLYGGCSIIDTDGKEIRRAVTLYKEKIGWFYSRHILLCENYINQPSTFWRMALWRKVGGIDESYKFAFDYELWLRMAQHSPALRLDRRLASFRRHPDSISENSFNVQFLEELDIGRRYGSFIHRISHRSLIAIRLAIYLHILTKNSKI